MSERCEAIVRPAVRVIVEGDAEGWSAYCPSIHTVIATGKTRRAVERRIRDALTFHLEGLHEDALNEENRGLAEEASQSFGT